LDASAIEKSPLLPGHSSGSQEKAVRNHGPYGERATGVEPATSSLGSWHSTTELRPQRPETVAHSSSPRNTRARARFLDCPRTHAYDPRTRMATPRARTSSPQTTIRALCEASARAREVFLQEHAEALERAVDLVAEAP